MNHLAAVVAPLRGHSRVVFPLAVLLLSSYAYFVGAPAWNQNSRLALTRALVERGSVIIDRDHETTGDKSLREGHFYCDKAPGASALAAIPYAVLYGISRATRSELPGVGVHSLDPVVRAAGREPAAGDRRPGDRLVYNRAHRLALYICSLFTVGLASILAGLAVFLLVLRQSQNDARQAAIVAAAYGLGTPAFVYSTALYGHQLGASLLVIAFALVVLTPSDPGPAASLAAGALLGLAVCTEYPAIVPAALIFGLAWRRFGFRGARWVVAGGLPFAVALGLYHDIAFGSPFATGYDFVYREEFAEGMRDNYGLGVPRIRVALELAFGSYRGLFYVAPILLIAAWGLAKRLQRPGGLDRSPIAIAVAIVIYYLLLNAGYYMWDGGASAGPRHLVPALPFLALGLGAGRRAAPLLFAALATVSVGQMLLMAAAAPEASQFGNPVWDYAIDRVFTRLPDHSGATNVGLLIGLPGPLALLPLLAVWIWGFGSVRARHSGGSGGA